LFERLWVRINAEEDNAKHWQSRGLFERLWVRINAEEDNAKHWQSRGLFERLWVRINAEEDVLNEVKTAVLRRISRNILFKPNKYYSV
jgi:uncharacterized membrane protein